MIHLNTAGAGLMPLSVSTAMFECVHREALYGAYETEVHYDKVLQYEVYDRVARLLNAPREDIALFDSATRAWCSVVCRLALGPRDRIWITPYEYAGNLITLQSLRERTGCRIDIVPLRPNGDLDLDWMATAINDDVALVTVTHIPSGCGIVNPVAEIGQILAPYRCVYAVDGCQSVGQVPVDVDSIGCHLFTGAGRKFLRGPRGTGFAYVAPELRASIAPEFHDLHVARVASVSRYLVEDDSARALELAERTTAAFVGFNAALACHETADMSGRQALFEALRSAIGDLPGIELIAPGRRQTGIVTFRHEAVPADRIYQEMRAREINMWLIRGDHTPLYMSSRGVSTALRASLHYYNTAGQVAAAARALAEVVGPDR